jgi:hypothetical protein
MVRGAIGAGAHAWICPAWCLPTAPTGDERERGMALSPGRWAHPAFCSALLACCLWKGKQTTRWQPWQCCGRSCSGFLGPKRQVSRRGRALLSDLHDWGAGRVSLDSRNAVSYARSWTPVAVGPHAMRGGRAGDPPCPVLDRAARSIRASQGSYPCPRMSYRVILFPCAAPTGTRLSVCGSRPDSAGAFQTRTLRRASFNGSDNATSLRQFTGLRAMRAGESREKISAAPWSGLACARDGSRSPRGRRAGDYLTPAETGRRTRARRCGDQERQRWMDGRAAAWACAG